MTEEKKNEKPRRVFQCLDANYPKQLPTLSTHGHQEGGVSYPSRCRVITANAAAQFVLLEDAPDYDVQYAALKLAGKRGRWQMVELGAKDELVKPKFLEKEKSDKESLIETQRLLDEKSDLLTTTAQAIVSKDKDAEAKDAEIKQLKAKLAARS